MGAKFGFIAIKTIDSEKLLDAVDEYYKGFGLSLVEERIGTRTGKYVQSPRSYVNFAEYDKFNAAQYEKANLTTNFDFYDQLEEPKGWSIFMYYPRLVKYTLNINSGFASFLSKKLSTTVIEYFQFDIVCQVILRSHENGWTKDRFSTGDLEIDEAEGYFEQYMNKKVESYDNIFTITEAYFQSIGYRAGSKLPDDEKSRRPMYLKGKPDDVENFVLHKQQVF